MGDRASLPHLGIGMGPTVPPSAHGFMLCGSTRFSLPPEHLGRRRMRNASSERSGVNASITSLS